MPAMGDLDRKGVCELHRAELEVFTRERPRTGELLARGTRSMPNGVPMVLGAIFSK